MEKIEALADTESFTRKMRLKDFFHNRGPNHKSTNKSDMSRYGIKSQAIPSLWTPSGGTNTQLDEFCTSMHNHISLTPSTASYDNLTPGERAELNQFSKNINDSIVIREADKGGAVVIQDTVAYIHSCETLLSDANFYTPLMKDPTPMLQTQLSHLLKQLAKTHNLEDILKLSDLITRFPKPGRFYTNPKIHKGLSPFPGRPHY